ncbi:MSMEG_0570 family nitrogen starvation response protein [Xylophilus rhododendri]|uniref:MSMEG_0570 family nitrogen starvation response protein n=1 Tax=Xylophilus rhododendri TaxID=2697032 RepID=A0A857JAA9_9BURK|nr:MSMEG_0570 family nitrogen starvation response protein [Xylophilus rhododendri]QHJ00951.1 MSMEG_0570 family nitrogen starvation response protein [Xylophilus rhododendri]
MPAMHYTVRWPDATQSTCYSPSLVIQDFFQPGQDYPLDDFLRRVREATAIASDRVRAKFGFACSMAADQLVEIETRARDFSETPGAQVHVVAFDTGTA